jgi:hypothetical protein
MAAITAVASQNLLLTANYGDSQDRAEQCDPEDSHSKHTSPPYESTVVETDVAKPQTRAGARAVLPKPACPRLSRPIPALPAKPRFRFPPKEKQLTLRPAKNA